MDNQREVTPKVTPKVPMESAEELYPLGIIKTLTRHGTRPTVDEIAAMVVGHLRAANIIYVGLQSKWLNGEDRIASTAKEAYAIADAMIAERTRREKAG